jgi:hypothetical protein
MSDYHPDKWVLVEINSIEHGKITKVLASWFGGYLGSDSWKLSSGVDKITETDDGYEFHNTSGSIYACYKESYGMSSYTAMVYSTLVDRINALEDGSIQILDENKILDAHLIK